MKIKQISVKVKTRRLKQYFYGGIYSGIKCYTDNEVLYRVYGYYRTKDFTQKEFENYFKICK